MEKSKLTTPTEHIQFNVIIEDNGRFKPYDIMRHLMREYANARTKPKTHVEFMEFVKKESMYQWWSRCEYEIILSDWPCQKNQVKWDIYKQIMMNHELVSYILEYNVLHVLPYIRNEKKECVEPFSMG